MNAIVLKILNPPFRARVDIECKNLLQNGHRKQLKAINMKFNLCFKWAKYHCGKAMKSMNVVLRFLFPRIIQIKILFPEMISW